MFRTQQVNSPRLAVLIVSFTLVGGGAATAEPPKASCEPATATAETGGTEACAAWKVVTDIEATDPVKPAEQSALDQQIARALFGIDPGAFGK